MNYDPTPAQALLLFGVLARHGACRQAELMPKVKKADREALGKAKLIDVGKADGGRGFKLTLNDDGWAWVAEHLSATLPPAQRTLSDVLARVSEHLARSGGTLADFIGTKPQETSPEQPSARRRSRSEAKTKKAKSLSPVSAPQPTARKRTRSGAKPTKAKLPSPATLRKRIETAYLTLTHGSKNQSVRLARLRAELSDLDRATVDAGLGRILKGDKKASLMRHDDPHQLDQADHDAAFSPAGEPYHVIWISS